jgi:amino acid transporter
MRYGEQIIFYINLFKYTTKKKLTRKRNHQPLLQVVAITTIIFLLYILFNLDYLKFIKY